MNNAVLGEAMENIANIRNIKLVATETERNYLVSEPNHQATIFSKSLFAIEQKRTQTLINKPV